MKNSPMKDVKAYVVAGHLSWLVVSPLVLFIGGGSWLSARMGWGDWTMILFILAGLSVMLLSVVSYLKQLIDVFGKESDSLGTSNKNQTLKLDNSDYDY